MVAKTLVILLVATLLSCVETARQAEPRNPGVKVRAIYGGIPGEEQEGSTLEDFGVNAVFVGSGSVTEERVQWVHGQGARIYAEFNTLHRADYLEDHPDAAPVGADGKISPPPHGWQGICPTHPDYRRERMQAFRSLLRSHQLDGVWLDYHHSHASWERDQPAMPDTCFCRRCIRLFSSDLSLDLPENDELGELGARILSNYEAQWTRWRCDLFTDWVREFRAIVDEERPGALLGTFHNPWGDEDYGGARITKLAIDLKAQAEYIDVFSPMPYHARFGHSNDLDWISERVNWLGDYLDVTGREGEDLQIWPIVQLSDWGEEVPVEDVSEVLYQGTQPPATGIIVFAWGSLQKQSEKVEETWRFFRRLAEKP